MSGWIKLHREILDWEWYHHAPTVSVFIHLLLTVNRKPSKYMGHKIPAGSRVIGRKALAEALGLTEQNVRTALHHLKLTKDVTIKATNKFSIITVLNWDLYQSDSRRTTNKQPTTNQQLTTVQEGEKDISKDISIGGEKVSRAVWEDFLKLRKAKKAEVTDTALNGISREAARAGWPLEKALQEICTRGWTGFKAEWVENGNTGKLNGKSKKQRARDALQRSVAETSGEVIAFGGDP